MTTLHLPNNPYSGIRQEISDGLVEPISGLNPTLQNLIDAGIVTILTDWNTIGAGGKVGNQITYLLNNPGLGESYYSVCILKPIGSTHYYITQDNIKNVSATGLTEPIWPDDGSPVLDGNYTWADLGETFPTPTVYDPTASYQKGNSIYAVWLWANDGHLYVLDSIDPTVTMPMGRIDWNYINHDGYINADNFPDGNNPAVDGVDVGALFPFSGRTIGQPVNGDTYDPTAGSGLYAPFGSLYLADDGGGLTQLYIKVDSPTQPTHWDILTANAFPVID